MMVYLLILILIQAFIKVENNIFKGIYLYSYDCGVCGQASPEACFLGGCPSLVGKHSLRRKSPFVHMTAESKSLSLISIS